MSPAALILAALDTLPHGCWQRTDGLRCECGVIGLSDRQYRRALRGLLRLGLIERGTQRGAHWTMDTYRSAVKNAACEHGQDWDSCPVCCH